MHDLKICRICLNSGLKMYSYDSYYLKQYYEEVLAIKLHEDDKLPHQFCYECAAMLYKFHKFKEKCWSGQQLLCSLLCKEPITQQSVSKLNTNIILKSSIGIVTKNKNVRTFSMKTKALSDVLDAEINKEQVTLIITPVTNISIDEKHQNETVKTEFNDTITPVEGNNLEATTIEVQSGMKIEVIDEINDNDTLHDFNDEIDCDNEMDVDKNNDNHHDFKDEIECNNGTDINKSSTVNLIETEQIVADNIEVTVEKKCTVKRTKKDKVCKEKKFEHVKKNCFDPKHWLIVNLSDNEAVEEFKARGNDCKFLGAAFKCTSCLKGFSKEEMLARHTKMRHDESRGPMSCRFCSMRFKWPSLLNIHTTEHYVRYKCLRCELTFALRNAALSHNDYHNGVIRKCAHCGEEFRHQSTYYTHLRSHRSEHVCTLCGESFVNETGLMLHRKNMHPDDVTSAKNDVNAFCAKCDVKFDSKKAYQRHLFHSAKHGGNVEDAGEFNESPPAPHKLNSGNLTLKSFTRKPRKPTPCNICGKNFSSYIAYIRHHDMAHKGAPTVPIDPTRPGGKGERYVCEICGVSLARCSMETHLNTHTREIRFTCDTCGRDFSTKTILKQHQLTHTTEKPVPCPLCEKRFKQSSSMKLHYRTFHLKEPYPKRNRKDRKKNEEFLKLDEDGQESDEDMTLDKWR